MGDAVTGGCRIARWRPKRGGAVVEVLPTPPDPDESNFVSTLIWAIDQARKGTIVGYAMVFEVELPDGMIRSIEASKPFTEHDRHHVLGLIRRMEANYMVREWPDSPC